MSTTTKNLDVTFTYDELPSGGSKQPSDKTRKISIPCNGAIANEGIRTRVKAIDAALQNPSASGTQEQRYAYDMQFLLSEIDDFDTQYFPSGITKAEIVTITEDVIYGN